jgi:hypothetical protein
VKASISAGLRPANIIIPLIINPLDNEGYGSPEMTGSAISGLTLLGLPRARATAAGAGDAAERWRACSFSCCCCVSRAGLRW